MIGMVLLRPGWERDYEGRPPVYPVGCSGVITHVERLPDGRYNIVLRGLERFRIVDEDHDAELSARARSSRCSRCRCGTTTAPPIRSQRIEARGAAGAVRRTADAARSRPRMPAAMPDEDLVNALAQYLDLEPLEKQALLEQHCLRSARRVARRAARDEDHDGADAGRVERRALKRSSRLSAEASAKADHP